MSDITATTVTADGVAVNHPARVKGMYFVRAATAGSVVLKDGGSTGTTLLTITTPAAGSGEDDAGQSPSQAMALSLAPTSMLTLPT